MTIERMNQVIDKYTAEIEETERKRDAVIKERDMALAAQTQKIFAKHHIPPEELMKLKYVKADQLKALLAEIGESGEVTPVKKDEKEIKDHAKEVTP